MRYYLFNQNQNQMYCYCSASATKLAAHPQCAQSNKKKVNGKRSNL